MLRNHITENTSKVEIPNRYDNRTSKIRIMRTKAKSQSQSSLFINQTNQSTNGIINTKDLNFKRNQSFHESSCGLNPIQNQSLLGNNHIKNVVIHQSIQDIIRKKGAHSFSTSNQQSQNTTKQQLNYQPINSAKSTMNYNNTISTSLGQYQQISILNQSQSITQLPNAQQQIPSNRTHCSKSFASNRDTSYSMGVTSRAKISFYHHSNIFKLKQYKNLARYGINTDNDDTDVSKDQQRSILIRQFRQKVEKYLLMAKYKKEQAIREFKVYCKTKEGQSLSLNDSRSRRKINNVQQENIPDQGVKGINRTKVCQTNRRVSYDENGGISFLSSRGMMNVGSPQHHKMIIPDDINQSLSMIEQNSLDFNRYLNNLNSSRFNYSQLSQQEGFTLDNNVNNLDVYLEEIEMNRQNQNDAKKFDHSKLQDMVLDRITKVIPSDIEYDQKIQRCIQEYERILDKLQNKTFRMKVPEHYEPQMQQFNEFYVIGEKKQNRIKRKEDGEEKEIPQSGINDKVISQVFQEERLREEDAKENEGESIEIDQIKKIEAVGKVVIKSAMSQVSNSADKVSNKKKEEKRNLEIGMKQEVIKSQRNIGGQANNNENEWFTSREGDTLEREEVFAEGSDQKQPRKVKERSAMEEYIIFRPVSPKFGTPKKPKRKEEINTKIISIESKKDPKARNKIEIPSIQIPDAVSKKEVSFNVTEKLSNRESNRSTNTNKSQSDRGEVKDTRAVGIDGDTASKQQKVEVTVPKKEENKYQGTTKVNRDNGNNYDQKQQSLPGADQTSVQKGDVSAFGSQMIQEIKPSSLKINDSGLSRQDPSSSNQQKQQLIDTDSLSKKSENGYEQEDDNEEEIASVYVVRNIPGQISGTPKQNGQTPINAENTSKYQNNTTTLPEKDNPYEQQSENTYYNELKPKKRIGTGLIDELVKISYLLDFNLKSFKKDRRIPEIPQELEFKRAEERLLFDQIFQWQYEVDLDIQEIEEKLKIPMKNRQHHDSEDDDDENGHNSKGSVHSSEITDFGPAPPLRNDMEEDDDEDFEDEEFNDQDE